MLAKTMPSILPRLTVPEALEVTKYFPLPDSFRVAPPHRPAPFSFAAPHASSVSLVGEHLSRPGEVSMSHRGILFLDEFPEFSRSILEI